MMKVEATPLFNKLSKWLWIYSDRDFGLAGLRIMTSTGQRNFGFYGFTVWNNLPSACHWTLSSGYIFWVTVSDEHRPVLLWHCFFVILAPFTGVQTYLLTYLVGITSHCRYEGKSPVRRAPSAGRDASRALPITDVEGDWVSGGTECAEASKKHRHGAVLLSATDPLCLSVRSTHDTEAPHGTDRRSVWTDTAQLDLTTSEPTSRTTKVELVQMAC